MHPPWREAECGTKIDITGRIAFGGIHGGALCRECRRGKSQVVSVSAGVLRAMAQLAHLEAQAWRRMEIDARMLGELRGVLNHYIANLLGWKPRMLRLPPRVLEIAGQLATGCRPPDAN